MFKKYFAVCAAALLIMGCGGKKKAEVTGLKSGIDPEAFHVEKDGKWINLYTLTNKAGMEVSITNYGGRIVSVMVPDKKGEFKDVVLGFDNIQDYFPENNQTDFGATIGRYANRINQGKITVEGVEYQLPQNNYGHCLHGGPNGWQYKVAEVVSGSGNTLKLKFDSPDGEANFPGHVTAYVTFTLTEDNAIDIRYEATTDKTTVINMTNHSYFNLSGDPANHSIEADELYINATNFTPVDDTFMTTGEIAPVEGTPMDFRKAKLVGKDINADYDQLHNGKGYDHNWVLDTKGDDTVLAAELYCPETGIALKQYTDEPGVQIYAGNFLDGTVTGKKGVVYNFRHAICLETQKYPDTPNKPDWPSATLKPGEKYTSHCVFAFSVR
ncbi:MAG: galactose mutarotase [Bacteroidales bacterium]|nr:galactose mutarotase [Bacteroidales bacterium]